MTPAEECAELVERAKREAHDHLATSPSTVPEDVFARALLASALRIEPVTHHGPWGRSGRRWFAYMPGGSRLPVDGRTEDEARRLGVEHLLATAKAE